jgi:hypothetical protein
VTTLLAGLTGSIGIADAASAKRLAAISVAATMMFFISDVPPEEHAKARSKVLNRQ